MIVFFNSCYIFALNIFKETGLNADDFENKDKPYNKFRYTVKMKFITMLLCCYVVMFIFVVLRLLYYICKYSCLPDPYWCILQIKLLLFIRGTQQSIIQHLHFLNISVQWQDSKVTVTGRRTYHFSRKIWPALNLLFFINENG